MKSFSLSVTVIAALLAFSLVSGLYIDRYTSKLLLAEKQLSETEYKTVSPDAIIRFEKTVMNGYKILTLICRRDQPNRIVYCFGRLKCAYADGNITAINLARADFIESVEALRRSERMDLGGII